MVDVNVQGWNLRTKNVSYIDVRHNTPCNLACLAADIVTPLEVEAYGTRQTMDRTDCAVRGCPFSCTCPASCQAEL
jgi:hypothetical protein